MNKNQIIIAVLAMSLLGNQSIVACDQPKLSMMNRVKQEYKAFKEAINCARIKGFSQCSPAQRKRVVAAGIAVAVTIAAITYGTIYGVRWWERKKQEESAASVAIEETEKEEREVSVPQTPGREKALIEELREQHRREGVSLRPENIRRYGSLINLPFFSAGFHFGDRSMVKRLITEKNFNVNARNVGIKYHDRFDTPLHMIARMGWVDEAKLLIKKGATIDAEDWYGCTPLAVALYERYPEKNRKEVAKLLVRSGANPFSKVGDRCVLERITDESLKKELLAEWRLRRATIERLLQATSDPTKLQDPTKKLPELPAEMIWQILNEACPLDKKIIDSLAMTGPIFYVCYS